MRRLEYALIISGITASALLILLSFYGCGDKTTTNNYANGDNSSVETNVTDVNAGGDGNSDQSQQPDNSDNSDNSVDNSDSSTTTNTNTQ